jgi:hypothetical protein
MCPACIASAALMAAGATSTGGLAALAMKLLHRIPQKPEFNEPEFKERMTNDNEPNRETARSVAS